MSKNRLYALFERLDAVELRQLDKYLRSPLFNQREGVLELFRYLRKHSPRKWTDERLLAYLYPGEEADVQKLHHERSFLLQHIEDYLVWKESAGDAIRQHLQLMRVYRRKHWDKGFQRHRRLLEQQLTQSPRRNAVHHGYQYEMQQEHYRHQRAKGRTRDFNLQELSEAQDIRYMAEKLRNACNMLSHQAVTKKEYDMGLLPAVLQRLQDQPHYLNIPAIALYYYAYMALSNMETEEYFQSLKAGIQAHIGWFSITEQRDVFLLATNYCIRRINTGNKGYIREAFELYRQGLERGVHLEEGILSKWTYNNIILLGLNLKEFDWVEGFIHGYKERLAADIREDSFLFNWAKFHFEKGDYDQAMPLLLQSKFDDRLHQLGARSMLAKMYYELLEWDALDNHLDSFQQYIHRQEDLGYHRENYLNIIHFIRRLMQVPDTAARHALIQEIKETAVLSEREWLLQQCQ